MLCSVSPFSQSRTPGMATDQSQARPGLSSDLCLMGMHGGLSPGLLTLSSWQWVSAPTSTKAGVQAASALRQCNRTPLGFLKLHPHTERGKSFHFIFKNYLSSVWRISLRLELISQVWQRWTLVNVLASFGRSLLSPHCSHSTVQMADILAEDVGFMGSRIGAGLYASFPF